MICFQGEYSKDSARFLAKRNIIVMTCIFWGLAFLSALVFFFVPGARQAFITGVAFSCCILIATLITVALPIYYKVSKKWKWAHIEIEDNVLFLDNKVVRLTRSMEDVKRVRDYGSFYVIDFYFPRRSIDFICQKDLLQEGSIMEFEELFKEYIVIKR